MTKKLTAFLLLLATFSIAHAEIFTVTSNADSGPGTLREAIDKAAANGTSETDYINFNIAGTDINSRTIVLKTVLPDLSSNLIIDASTQSGAKIGVSDAKVRITIVANTRINYVFRFIDTKDDAIYGLHFYNMLSADPNQFIAYGFAIQLHNCQNITIGAAGKGNYFTNVSFAVGDTWLPLPGKGMTTNFIFKANIVNLTEDGAQLSNPGTQAISLTNVTNALVGGTEIGEGNFIAGGNYSITFQIDTLNNIDVGYFKIIHNNFGCNYTKTAPLACGEVHIENQESYGYKSKGDVSILENSFDNYINAMSFDLTNCFYINNIKGALDVRGNHINTLVGGTYAGSATLSGFVIGGMNNGIIGGGNPGDANIISSCEGDGIALFDNKGVTISKNSLFCNRNGIHVETSWSAVPKTKISILSDHTVSGTTLPNSNVEVFLTKKCGGCENGETYLGTVLADDAGNWSFTSSVLLDGPVTATGTSPQGVTGEFAHPEMNFDHLDINGVVACGKSTGYIKGMQVESATRSFWLMPPYGFDTVYNKLDLDSLPAGSYRFFVQQGPYCYAQHEVNIGDYTPRIYATSVRLLQPSCNKMNGGVTDVYTYGQYDKLFWCDTSGKIVGTELTLSGVGPGRYKLVVLNEKYGCGDSTDYFTLVNQSGPSVTITAVKITDAKCGTATGSIQNVQISNITGTALIEWLDADDQTVGYTLDLKDIAGGTYHMILRDDSHCDITTEPIVVGGSNKTTIDISNVSITPSQCRYGSGSISGVNVTGATDYEWTNEKGVVVSQDKAPKALLPGTYTLTAGKATGCPKTGPALTVPIDPDMQFNPALQITITPTTCSQSNGSVILQNFPTPALYNFTWKQTNGTATVVATMLDLKNAAPSTYTLFASDAAGCTQRVTMASVQAVAPPQLQAASVRLQNDLCMEHTGSIQNLSITAGTAPFTYQWLNEQQQPTSNTINLQNSAAGTYHLVVKDANGCTVESAPFTLTNETKAFRTPQYADQLIPRNTRTTLTPQSSEAGTYEWFSDAALTQLLGINSSGVFITPDMPDDKTFYIRLNEGTCSSGTASVTVKVADDAKVFVPTAFTPNGDGKNDNIKPLVTGIFKLEYFTIYDRWGQIIFKTADLFKGWNGINKGFEAPAGTYVWMLKGTDYKGNMIQQKGTLILIR